MKNDRSLLATGVSGTAIAALCCFAPILVIVLGAVGLSAILGWLVVVLPAVLVFFIGLTAYAFWRRRRTAASAGAGTGAER
jgi:mercuric ion transport protein